MSTALYFLGLCFIYLISTIVIATGAIVIVAAIDTISKKIKQSGEENE